MFKLNFTSAQRNFHFPQHYGCVKLNLVTSFSSKSGENKNGFFQRGQIFKISSIEAGINPPLYSLVDLMNDKVPQKYYAKQLTKAPNPNLQKDIFAVEKVLATKKVKGVKYFKCRFLYYPPKFDQYIKESDMIFGPDMNKKK